MADKHPLHQVIADNVIVTATPDFAAESTTELLFGEQIEVLETHIDKDDEEWSRVRSRVDGYEGYVPSGLLDDEPTDATHKVSALRTFALCEPDFKSPPLRCLSYMSPLSVVVEDNGFSLLDQGSWVYTGHIRPADSLNTDHVESALRFVGTPYLWGGRTSLGLDCSALVQLCVMDAGHSCARDSKDQISTLGEPVEFGDTIQYGALQRGDIVFFEGHVGIMVDEDNIINATARHMHVCVEPLDTVSDAYNGILAVRRLPSVKL